MRIKTKGLEALVGLAMATSILTPKADAQNYYGLGRRGFQAYTISQSYRAYSVGTSPSYAPYYNSYMGGYNSGYGYGNSTGYYARTNNMSYNSYNPGALYGGPYGRYSGAGYMNGYGSGYNYGYYGGRR